METLKISTPGDVANVIPRILQFHPQDSLVILSLGGGPIARIDLGTASEMADALSSALHHWSNGVIVAFYCDAETFESRESELDRILPGVPVRIALRIDGGMTFHPGDLYGTSYSDAPTGTALDSTTVQTSRHALEDDAATINDAATAEILAVAAYLEGVGARAWVYADRAVALSNGVVSARMQTLGRLLQSAVPPKAGAAILDEV